MSEPPTSSVRWTQRDVDQRLDKVREVLLSFLRSRTRLDWFKHKVRWRLSRRTIWPGGPEGLDALMAAVDRDAGVEALVSHLAAERAAIVGAIEHYNTAVRRLMEQEVGSEVSVFDPEAMGKLRQARITFEGTRDELLRRARDLTPNSEPELVPEILSMRLALVSEEVRDEIFSEVAAIVAGERADLADLTSEQREGLAEELELRLRALDRFHVASLLAESYAEARRFMEIDRLMETFERLHHDELAAPGADPRRTARLHLLRDALNLEITFLERIFPKTAGTHRRERQRLQE